MQASSKRIPGVARLLLGLFAWLGEKFGLITRRTAGWANFGSAVSGVYRRLRLTAGDGDTCRESGPPYLGMASAGRTRLASGGCRPLG